MAVPSKYKKGFFIKEIFEFEHPQAQVFVAWAAPANKGRLMEEKEIELVKGGKFKAVSEASSGTVEVTGEFIEVRPPEFLSFTKKWSEGDLETFVEVFFKDSKKGTEVEIRQFGFDAEETATLQKAAWKEYLEFLNSTLETKQL